MSGELNVRRYTYTVQQKDHHFSHVSWSRDPTVTPNNRCREMLKRCHGGIVDAARCFDVPAY